MAETGCLKDGHFQTLEVEGLVTNSNDRVQIGDFLIGKAITHTTVKGTFDKTIRNTLTSGDTPDLVFRQLQLYLASLIDDSTNLAAPTMSSSNAKKLGFNMEDTVIGENSSNITIAQSTIKIINNTDVGSGGDISAASDSLAEGQECLIVFGTNNPMTSGTFIINFGAEDTIADNVEAGVELLRNTFAGDFETYTRTTNSHIQSADTALTITAGSGVNIQKGSFIYLNSQGGGTVNLVIKAFILTEGNALESIVSS